MVDRAIYKGDRLVCWPGARGGRAYLATALTGPVPFSGTTCVRVERDSGGTDYIALSHVEHLDDDDQSVADMARAFSLWINDEYSPSLSPEALMWRRATKVVQEAGEAHEAVGLYWGENPRKVDGKTEQELMAEILKELADCAFAAMGAIEHLTGHEGRSLEIVNERARFVCDRVGVLVAP